MDEKTFKVLKAYLCDSWSHRDIERDILELPEPVSHIGYKAMNLLHNYCVSREHKGLLNGQNVTRENILHLFEVANMPERSQGQKGPRRGDGLTPKAILQAEIPDGLKTLLRVISLREIASLIERTARWVAPETFKLLPLWFPEYARQSLLYNENWSKPRHKPESNVNASKALTLALGLKGKDRPNWSCCHIWGVDDPKSSNNVVKDHRFYSCVANMVLLPTPLKAFTDAITDIKAMLRICAHNLYGWQCDHDSLCETNAALDSWKDWDSYPVSWPKTAHDKKVPLGVIELSETIKASAKKRLEDIRHDLKHAGSHYPREEVKTALAYWERVLPNHRFLP